MKTLRSIVFVCALLLSQWIGAAASLVSSDPDWLGGTERFSSTEGNDFWLTFMNNNTFDPEKPDNATTKFEMKIAVSAREEMDVVIAIGNSPLTTLHVEAGETQVYELQRGLAGQIYLLESETTGKQGVHVYADPSSAENKKKVFSCFLYGRACDAPLTSRDASLVIPTRFLGKEYIVQTYPQDVYSSEFAIVATEDNTEVTITPSFETGNGHAVNEPFTISLAKGDAYLVASKRHEEGSTDFKADLSGSIICTDKPVAVFQGNQQTGIPNKEGYSQDFMVEQTLPVTQWGTEFYLSCLTNTKVNYADIIALEDGTSVNIRIYNKNTGAVTTLTPSLNRGETLQKTLNQLIGLNDGTRNEVIINTDKPVSCITYITTAAENKICDDTGLSDVCYIYGDPANANMPDWSHRVKSMNLFSEKMDPQGGDETPQHFYAYVVTRTADIASFTLNGTAVPSSAFHAFNAENEMAYAHIELPHADAAIYNLLETTGDGFVGMVYGLTEAQGYFYTLGFRPAYYGDSLYVTNTEEIMSRASYDMDSLDGRGWYQRQWNEWMDGAERLDTAIVCDSTVVYWALETPAEKPVERIEWSIYDVTDGGKAGSSTLLEGFPQDGALTPDKHLFEYKFILPEEEMEERHQFFEYEIQAVLFRTLKMCETEETDTLKTTVRVTRMYNDTLYRVLCVGDTLSFFYDSLYNQSDLTLYNTPADSAATKFAGVKKGEGDAYVEPWVYQVEAGKYDTLTRRYLSQAGCDSVMTLVLFVCDTFQFFDTIHLCSNQDTVYHERKFRAADYWEPRDDLSVPLKSDTIDTRVSFYTQDCECQQSEFSSKFRDKNGREFRGCDSVYYLHLVLHPSYRIQEYDTVCLDKNGKGSYTWSIQNGTDTRVVTQDDAVLNDALGAKAHTFVDSLYTHSCPECNQGVQGCDSFIVKTTIFPDSYHFEEEASWCQLKYDPVKKDTVHRYFEWTDHLDGNGKVRVLRESGDYYDSCQTTRYGCDSIYHLRLDYRASAELYERTDTTLCFDSTAVFKWLDHNGELLQTFTLDKVGTIERYDDSRCDTVYALSLRVLPTYFIIDSVLMTQEDTCIWAVTGKIYGGTKTTLKYDSLITTDTTIIRRDFLTTPVNGVSCDSVRVLFLRIGSVFRDTVSRFVCEEDPFFTWVEDRPEYCPDGAPFERLTITDLPAPRKDSIYLQAFETTLGFDSIFYLRLYRAPSFHKDTAIDVCQDTVSPFVWEDHPDIDPIPIDVAGNFVFPDIHKTDSFGCDSVWTLLLRVHPFYSDTVSYPACQFSDFVWEEQDPSFVAPDSVMTMEGKRIPEIPTAHAGDFLYSLRFHTVHGCDSILYLKLHVDTVYRTPVDTTERVMCDNQTLSFYDRTIYGALYPSIPDGSSSVAIPGDKPFFTFDTACIMPSSTGCDSAIVHRITMYRTYVKEETDSVCQGTAYSWHGLTIDSKFMKSDSIYTFYDSLKTEHCPVCDPLTGECGCDSIHILRLRVDSVYRFDESILLCDYDSVSWQGHHYAGIKLANPKAGYRILKSDTTYCDTTRWITIHGCDSIYYLTLRVAPSYDTTVVDSVCDNENRHIFEFSDSHGNYFRDSIPYAPHAAVPEKDTAVTHYDILHETVTHTLKTVEGCDSVVRFHLYIKPTYLFENKGKGCFGYAINWRGREITASNKYYDRLTTKDGCDSVFTLDFFVKPFITIPLHEDVCDNRSFFHYDTLYRFDGSISYQETEVWSPGRPKPEEYADVRFYGEDGCDSIVYRYYLTFHHAYFFEEEAEAPICSGEPYTSGELGHTWTKWAYEFDTDTFVVPYDTLFVDSLFTLTGCDSVYSLKAHVLPSYRHVTYDTICSNESYTWHSLLAGDSVLSDLKPGIYQLCDSFYTVNQCDSIYELRLCVNTAYFDESSYTLCADETYQWRSHFFEHMAPGEYFIYDSLSSTVSGCDSIYHLYLTVVDTTFETNHQVLCIGDTLFIGDHQYTQAGWYKDTTVNEAGCRHFIYTEIELIEPTVPTLWVEDAMCQSENAIDLYYTYSGRAPIGFTLYFDSIALEMGFEDMEDIAITTLSDTMVVSIPIPYRDGDKTQYPKPDNYGVTMVLDNGICMHSETDCVNDTSFAMSYPRWLIEQRHGDLIALLDSAYNGGYLWDAYQWYEDGQILVGQTKPYLYIPDGLTVGAQYHVALTRRGEETPFPTCAITAGADIIPDDHAPTMGYLDVTPTCVHIGHPYIYILSRKDGTYRINSSDGRFVDEGVFRADVTPVQIPAVSGLYIVQLWSTDTPEEPYRAIKVIVSDKCENCSSSSF